MILNIFFIYFLINIIIIIINVSFIWCVKKVMDQKIWHYTTWPYAGPVGLRIGRTIEYSIRCRFLLCDIIIIPNPHFTHENVCYIKTKTIFFIISSLFFMKIIHFFLVINLIVIISLVIFTFFLSFVPFC